MLKLCHFLSLKTYWPFFKKKAEKGFSSDYFGKIAQLMVSGTHFLSLRYPP